MTTPRKTTPAKKATAAPVKRAPRARAASGTPKAPARPANVVIDPSITAFDFDAEPPPPEPMKVHLFTLNKVDYYIPAKIDARVSVQYLVVLRDQGPALARLYMLEEALGPDAFAALMGWRGLTNETLLKLVTIVMTRTEGQVESIDRPLGRG